MVERVPSRSGGFQPAKPVMPRPANDNFPSPANDNNPVRPPPNSVVFGRRVRGRAAIKQAAALSRPMRAFFRANPYIRIAETIMEIYNYFEWQKVRNEGVVGYQLFRRCTGGTGTFTNGALNNCNPLWSNFVRQTGRPARLYEHRFDFNQPHPVIPNYYADYPVAEWVRVVVPGPGAETPQIRDPARNVGALPGGNRAPQRWELPAIDPFFWPPGLPQPQPTPLPYGVTVRPFPEWGNLSSRDEPITWPRIAVRHRYRRTPGGEKERKSKVREGVVVILKGGYAVTEGIDAVEAVHDALPKEYQAKSGAPPHEKAKRIYQHFEKIDLEKALFNLAVNHVIDLAIGTSAGKASDFFSRMGVTHGGVLSGVRGV